MSGGKRKSEDPAGKQDKTDEASEGQYGGLTGLGPGGGSDIEEVLNTDDIDPDEDETGRK